MAFRGLSKVFSLRPRLGLVQIPIRKFAEEAKSEENKASNGASENGKSEIEAKLKATETEMLHFKDLYLRAVAEQENMRKRFAKELDNEGNYAISKFAKEMVEIGDNLSRALSAVDSPDAPKESEKKLNDFYEGVKMTKEILSSVFNKFGIVEFSPLNEKFDPNLHEALFTYEDKAKEPGSVGQVMSTGFKIKDRVLRSAKVGVIKK